jgi:hypothetical protein
MYSTGYVSMAFSAMRIVSVNYEYTSFLGFTYAQFRFDLWASLEMFAAAVCVNVPTLYAGASRLRKNYYPISTRYESEEKRIVKNELYKIESATIATIESKFP